MDSPRKEWVIATHAASIARKLRDEFEAKGNYEMSEIHHRHMVEREARAAYFADLICRTELAADLDAWRKSDTGEQE